ncbi:cytochrome P450 [Roseimaritima sediminicola]|uniref:cytochrome P450 n=1 Tax=Roseimaritima sediminicola TaxID=2662066 RepID=UPI001298356C|nr:cytochrome P450 [Roseimaritima sediminicola]
MNEPKRPDWNPDAAEVQEDQVAAYDQLRRRGPLAWSESRGWSVLRHEDVLRVLNDHDSYSNVVSGHLSVPNGMDPPEHTPYRKMIEQYFTAERMRQFEPVCRGIADQLVDAALAAEQRVEVIGQLAAPFAARAQCVFLGWPESLHKTLISWTNRNQDAVRNRDREALSTLAREFEAIVDKIIDERRATKQQQRDDVTESLMRQQVHDRPLSNEELSSLFRNWTVGEIGTLSASIGILLNYLANHDDLQTQLRDEPDLLPVAIDEILRTHNPLASNRRVTKCPVQLGGQPLDAGEKLSINWISANRDESVFGDPDEVRLDRDPSLNLLYGAGIHVCPGAPLARMELRVFLQSLFARTTKIAPQPKQPPIRETYPASGFSSVVLELR